MTWRPAVVLLLAVILLIAAIELSSWGRRGRARSAIVPSASVSEVDTTVPQASEVDAPAPTPAPALTW